MHPVLALALLIVAGIGVTRLSRPRPTLHHPLLDGIVETGVPIVLLGALLGPGLGVLDDVTLHVLEPIIALGIGWVGASFGARLEWRMLRRVSRRTWLVGAALAVPVPMLALSWCLGWAATHVLRGHYCGRIESPGQCGRCFDGEEQQRQCGG